MEDKIDQIIRRLNWETDLDWGRCEGIRDMVRRRLDGGMGQEECVDSMIETLR